VGRRRTSGIILRAPYSCGSPAWIFESMSSKGTNMWNSNRITCPKSRADGEYRSLVKDYLGTDSRGRILRHSRLLAGEFFADRMDLTNLVDIKATVQGFFNNDFRGIYDFGL